MQKSLMLAFGIATIVVISACAIALAENRYEISASGADGTGVWRLDRLTGRISICGTVIPGASVSYEKSQIDRYNPFNIFSEISAPTPEQIADWKARLKLAEARMRDSVPQCSDWGR